MLPKVSPSSRDIEFVIIDDRDRFHGAPGKPRLSKRDAIRSPRARSFIDAVQPFREASGNPADHPPWILHELLTAGKHCRLLLTQAAFRGSRRIPIYPGSARSTSLQASAEA